MKQRIFAHRGACAYAPENTLEAFELAVRMGAHGVELDAHLSRDGEVVVTHDERIDRVSDGTGAVQDLTLKELKAFRFNRPHPEYADARIPTLKEVFQLLKPTGLHINIELKNSWNPYPGLEEKVIDLIGKEFSPERIIFSSFNHASMVKVKQIDPSLCCGLLYDASMVRPWIYAQALGVDALHPNYAEVLIPGGECAAAHKAGILVHPWTVNDPGHIRAMLREGADIVITNVPDVALQCLAEI